MKAKIITWIMALGLVLLISTVVWADGRQHHRDNRPPRRIVAERYPPGSHHSQYRRHPAHHKRWVKQRRRAPRRYVHNHYCGPVRGYYYGGHPRYGGHRMEGVWVGPGWTFSISRGGRW